MKNKNISIAYQEFSDIEMLNESQKKILNKARVSAKNAYNPYSHFFVGCAILLDNTKIITGFNIENASYPVGICAERTTLSAAITQYPKNKIVAIAISYFYNKSNNDTPAYPCGMCRQFINECEDRNENPIPILLSGQKGVVHIFKSIKDLLPFSFGKNNLI